MEWQFVRELEDDLGEFQRSYDLDLDEDLRDLIEEYNGGIPDKENFDTLFTQSRILSRLLSFNREDDENVYAVMDLLSEIGEESLLPFATDPFGNFLCLLDGEVVYYPLEDGEIEYTGKNLNEFIAALY